MVRTIMFQKKRYSVANETLLMRHGKRKKIRNPQKNALVGLTQEGMLESFQLGLEMMQDKKLKTYFSPSKRTRQTAYHIRNGFKAAGGQVGVAKRAKSTGTRKELLIPDLFMDNKYAEEEYNKVGRDTTKMIRKWLDGGYDPTKIRSPADISKRMHNRLALGRRAADKGVTGYRILNVTHDWQILAKLENLIGVKFETHGFKSPVPNEAIVIYHTTAGKDILDYQGKRFDVTSALAKAKK
jgi:broad specificity phosphatase PhoE